MTKRSTKQQLMLSAISLLLCVSMLIGSTFAWFTDSVTSTNNIIKSGTLDVELYYQVEGQTDWTKVTETTNIFKENALWEPGYTEVVKLKVVNEGTLALKYQLGVNVASETAGTLEDNSTFMLSNFIKFGIVDGAQSYTRDEAIAAVNATATPLATAFNSQTKQILPLNATNTDNEDIVTMVVYMPTTVGNEANYRGTQPVINLGINLFATQLEYEEDSFDNTYDEGLTPPDADGDILVEEDGIQYLYREDGSYWLYYVTPEYTGDTVVVPEGVTTIGGSAFSYNNNVKTIIFSSTVRTVRTNILKGNTSVEKIVLNEGLTDLSTYERPFNQAKGLKEVVFPSTLKKIGKQAFAGTAIETLTIPSSVEEIYEGAFRDITNLKTVTIEGNPKIGNFAFRTCLNLETVYLNGEDVTFTGNSQVFTHADSGDATGITVYVKNDTVASRLAAAQPSAQGLVIKVAGSLVKYAKNATELQKALDNATEDTLVIFSNDIAGDVMVTQKQGVNVTIDGKGNNFNGIMRVFGNGKGATRTETLTIKNIDFVASNGADSCILSPDRTYHNPAAYSSSHNVTVENCTFTMSDNSADCAAIRHGDGGDENWTVTGCTVDNTMHSIFQVNNVTGKLTVNDCEVYSKNGANLNSCTNVEFNDCKFDVKGYAVRFGVKSGGNLTEAKNFVINDSTLKSAGDDGDAVIIFRASAANAVLTLNNTTLDGVTEFSGVTADTTINR